MTELFIVIDIIMVILKGAIIFLIPFLFFKAKYNKLITFVIYFGVYLLISYMFIYDPRSVTRWFVFAIFEILYTAFLFKDTPLKKVFFLAIKYLLLIFSDIVTMFLLSNLFNNLDPFSIWNEFSFVRVCTYAIFDVFLLFITLVFIIVFRNTSIKIKYPWLFIILPLNQILLLVIICLRNPLTSSQFDVILTIGGVVFSIVSDIVMLFSFSKIAENEEMRQKLLITENINQADKQYYQLIKQYSHEINMIRHDFKDQVATAYGVIEEYSDNDRIIAKKMLDKLNENVDKVRIPVVCENKVINSIVNIKKEEANLKGIDAQINIDVPEKNKCFGNGLVSNFL